MQSVHVSGRQRLAGRRVRVGAPRQRSRPAKVGAEKSEHLRPRCCGGHIILSQARVDCPGVEGSRQGRGQVAKPLDVRVAKLSPVELSSVSGLGEAPAGRRQAAPAPGQIGALDGRLRAGRESGRLVGVRRDVDGIDCQGRNE